jgi:hypothetical protein
MDGMAASWVLVLRQLPRINFSGQAVPAIFDPYSSDYMQSIVVLGVLVMAVAVVLCALFFSVAFGIYCAVKGSVTAQLQRYMQFRNTRMIYRAVHVLGCSGFMGLVVYNLCQAVVVIELLADMAVTDESMMDAYIWFRPAGPEIDAIEVWIAFAYQGETRVWTADGPARACGLECAAPCACAVANMRTRSHSPPRPTSSPVQPRPPLPLVLCRSSHARVQSDRKCCDVFGATDGRRAFWRASRSSTATAP